MSSDVHIQEIKSKVEAERVVISGLDSAIKDSYLKERLRRASLSLDDAELFVRKSLQAQTLDHVSMWLNGADTAIQIAAQQRKLVQDIVAKYGPNAQSIFPK